MSSQSEKLSVFLREVSNWSWDRFVRAELDKETYSSNEAIIFALIRACAMEQLQAIKVAVNRLDGKLKTPIRVEYPKIYYLFPNAKLGDPSKDSITLIGESGYAEITDNPVTVNEVKVMTDDEIAERNFNSQDEAKEETDLPSMGLRETLAKMSDYPRSLPEIILEVAQQTETWVRKQGKEPEEIPMVKSVVAAHLLKMAQDRNLDAISEVFDQIDGKLVETLQIVGEDIYITSYATDVPEGAALNKDGVWQIEATATQNMWAEKLGRESQA